MYIHFVDFEKAFDLVHKDSLWVIMKKYEIPKKLVKMVNTLYDDFQCSATEDNETTAPFSYDDWNQISCCMSGFLFLLIIDLVINRQSKKRQQEVHHYA